jgi:hypothetical protein
MLLLSPILAAVSAGVLAWIMSRITLNQRESGVVLVIVMAIYFPLWFWWLFGLYIDVYPASRLHGSLSQVMPPAAWALLCGAWVVVRFRRDHGGRATSSGAYINAFMQLGLVIVMTTIAIGVEGSQRMISARNGGMATPPSSATLLLVAGCVMLAFVCISYIRQRDPEIALLLLAVVPGMLVPVVGLGRLAASQS